MTSFDREMRGKIVQGYIKRIYEARFFWIHLARIELKNKFRRSKLGILWTFVSPLCLTLIMSVVFATAFHVELAEYAPYILSGILCWEVFSGSFVGGSYAIVSNDAYIRQFSHPITIYTLKSAIVITVSFMISLIAITIWMLFKSPVNLLIAAFTLPMTVFIYFVFAWSGTTIAAFICTKYRDYPQLAPLVLQTLWYVSPVFFQENMFEAVPILHTWFNLNPITHMLMLIRKPFLYGELPSTANYLFSIVFVALIAFLAIRIAKKDSKDIIFYI